MSYRHFSLQIVAELEIYFRFEKQRQIFATRCKVTLSVSANGTGRYIDAGDSTVYPRRTSRTRPATT